MAFIVIDTQSNQLGKKAQVIVIDSQFNQLNPTRTDFSGLGYLAGTSPTDHLKLPDGTPAADCLIELYSNGQKVSETRTDQDGSWRFDNIDHTIEYEIVASHYTLESIISTKRIPSILPVSSELIATFLEPSKIVYHYHILGGMGHGTYSSSDLSSSPNITLTTKDKILVVNITRVSTDETYQIQIESQGILEPFIFDVFSPAL